MSQIINVQTNKTYDDTTEEVSIVPCMAIQPPLEATQTEDMD